MHRLISEFSFLLSLFHFTQYFLKVTGKKKKKNKSKQGQALGLRSPESKACGGEEGRCSCVEPTPTPRLAPASVLGAESLAFAPVRSLHNHHLGNRSSSATPLRSSLRAGAQGLVGLSPPALSVGSGVLCFGLSCMAWDLGRGR